MITVEIHGGRRAILPTTWNFVSWPIAKVGIAHEGLPVRGSMTFRSTPGRAMELLTLPWKMNLRELGHHQLQSRHWQSG
jgi:hypothetical protein